MTAALEGGEWSAARSGRTLLPGKTRYPLYKRLGGPQGRSGRAENLVPTGIRSRTLQPVVCRYTDWATRPTDKYKRDTFFFLIFLPMKICHLHEPLDDFQNFKPGLSLYFLSSPFLNAVKWRFFFFFFFKFWQPTVVLCTIWLIVRTVTLFLNLQWSVLCSYT